MLHPPYDKTTMRVLKISLQLVFGCLFWLLAIYWIVLVSYSVTNFVTGGSSSVVGWYSHIGGMQFHWTWKRFLASQTALLVTTLAVYFLRRQIRRWVAGGANKAASKLGQSGTEHF